MKIQVGFIHTKFVILILGIAVLFLMTIFTTYWSLVHWGVA